MLRLFRERLEGMREVAYVASYWWIMPTAPNLMSSIHADPGVMYRHRSRLAAMLQMTLVVIGGALNYSHCSTMPSKSWPLHAASI